MNGRRMSRRGTMNVAIAAAAALLLAAGVAAQETISTADGVYTEEQAARGLQSYTQECAACHLDDLMGDGIAFALVGDAFHFRWGELSLSDMVLAIRTTMPQGAPASLSPQAYIDIVSYMLQKNDFPAGDTELSPDPAELESIMIPTFEP